MMIGLDFATVLLEVLSVSDFIWPLAEGAGPDSDQSWLCRRFGGIFCE